VANLNKVFKDTTVLVVAHYQGLTVSEMTELRAKVREAGASIKVAKNRLAKLALQGTELEHVTDLFQGPTIIAYSDDPVAAPKAVADFAKQNEKLVVLGGALGTTNLDVDGVKSLANLPSLDELRAKLLGMISTPASRIAMVLQAPGGQVARVLGAYAEKDKAA
jgi:large subunit ribosomal protein L10